VQLSEPVLHFSQFSGTFKHPTSSVLPRRQHFAELFAAVEFPGIFKTAVFESDSKGRLFFISDKRASRLGCVRLLLRKSWASHVWIWSPLQLAAQLVGWTAGSATHGRRLILIEQRFSMLSAYSYPLS
jgi:hypothetical protein